MGDDSAGLGVAYLKERATKAETNLEHEDKMRAEKAEKESAVKFAKERAWKERIKKGNAHEGTMKKEQAAKLKTEQGWKESGDKMAKRAEMTRKKHGEKTSKEL